MQRWNDSAQVEAGPAGYRMQAYWIVPLIQAGVAAYGAYKGNQKQKTADRANNEALWERQHEYDQKAPLRNLGLQGLGNVEAPMDLGNLGYDANNPFAKARGPSSSVANIGNWGTHTFQAPLENPTTDRDAAERADIIKNIQNEKGLPPKLRQRMLQGFSAIPSPAPTTPPATYGWAK